MAKIAFRRVAASVTLAVLTAAALGASEHYKTGRRLAEKVASLAASVERLQERPPERIAERITAREAEAAPRAAERDLARVESSGQAQAPSDDFDQSDLREYASGRGPHPLERRFASEPPGQGRDVARRQQALGDKLREATRDLDVDVHSAECRASTCRVEATFDSPMTSNALFERAFLRTDEAGNEVFEHGGVHVPVQGPVGDRYHVVFYVLKKPSEG